MAMKTYKDSTEDFICQICGAHIFNATHDYNFVCPECGGNLKAKDWGKDKDNGNQFCRFEKAI